MRQSWARKVTYCLEDSEIFRWTRKIDSILTKQNVTVINANRPIKNSEFNNMPSEAMCFS